MNLYWKTHVNQAYFLEEGKALKIAHNLKKVSLNPNCIVRMSSQHALSTLIIYGCPLRCVIYKLIAFLH